MAALMAAVQAVAEEASEPLLEDSPSWAEDTSPLPSLPPRGPPQSPGKQCVCAGMGVSSFPKQLSISHTENAD